MSAKPHPLSACVPKGCQNQPLAHMPEGEQVCAICGGPAACYGLYDPIDSEEVVQFACDECCGHGNEDGWCIRVPEPEPAPVHAANKESEER